MSEKSDVFVAHCLRSIRVIDDPVDLQRYLRELVEAEFPANKPIFSPGEKMPMHEFLARYQREICGGTVPAFYQTPVRVIEATGQFVEIAIDNAAAAAPPVRGEALGVRGFGPEAGD